MNRASFYRLLSSMANLSVRNKAFEHNPLVRWWKAGDDQFRDAGLAPPPAVFGGLVCWRTGRRRMSNLNLGIEIRDFDLERMGFSLSVLDESKKRQASEAYLRMTLLELHAFLNALKAAENEIALTTYDSNGVNKLPPLKGMAGREVEPAERRGDKRTAAE